jgi:mannose-6-phosphate isomerase-like protein (cupin superfamily)
MHITPKDSLIRKPDDFITIHEYISRQKSGEISVVMAELNGVHSKRMNKRCTRVYILLSGKLDVELESATHHINAGEMLLVRPGQWCTMTGHNAKMYVIHTPAFDPGYESIEET